MQEPHIPIPCEDGFTLNGTLFIPEKTPKAAVMIAPATGIKQGFYKAFANYLSQNGFVAITYDNRGIGASVGKSINASNPSLTHWGVLDMTAVLECLKLRFPSLEYHLVGHSAGGQLVGLMKNARELKSMFTYASSSGSLKHMKYPYKIKASFFLNFFIPVSNFIFGHTKSNWVGMGAPLPKEVGREWTRWCNGKGYVAVDLGTRIKNHEYDGLIFDTLWVHAEDDEIANTANVKDMLRVYPKITYKIISLSPNDYGFTALGHMKFFSSKKSKLWSLATDWLNKYNNKQH